MFLMEPSVNVALELQAIGRVYRMGQTRKVSVIRLIAANTIESKMLAARGKGKKIGGRIGSLSNDKASIKMEELEALLQ